MTEQKTREAYPSLYAMLWPWIMEICHENGYCAALHGSLRRDLDVVAVPWTEDAVPPAELAAAVAEKIGGFLEEPPKSPVLRPHGRLTWAMVFASTAYLDFSVFPPQGAINGNAAKSK